MSQSIFVIRLFVGAIHSYNLNEFTFSLRGFLFVFKFILSHLSQKLIDDPIMTNVLDPVLSDPAYFSDPSLYRP